VLELLNNLMSVVIKVTPCLTYLHVRLILITLMAFCTIVVFKLLDLIEIRVTAVSIRFG
jgi:hypothetical protein